MSRNAIVALGILVMLAACSKQQDNPVAKTHPPPDNWMTPKVPKVVPTQPPPPPPIPQPVALGEDKYLPIKTSTDFDALVVSLYPDAVSDAQLEAWMFPLAASSGMTPNAFERDELVKKKTAEIHQLRQADKGVRGFFIDSSTAGTGLRAVLGDYDVQEQKYTLPKNRFRAGVRLPDVASKPAEQLALPGVDPRDDNFPSIWKPDSLDKAKTIEARITDYNTNFTIRSYFQTISVDPNRFLFTYQLVALTIYDPISKQQIVKIGTP